MPARAPGALLGIVIRFVDVKHRILAVAAFILFAAGAVAHEFWMIADFASQSPEAPVAAGGNSPIGYDMAPEIRPEVVAAAMASIPR